MCLLHVMSMYWIIHWVSWVWWCSPAFHVVLSKDDHVDIVGGDKIGCSKDGEEDARIFEIYW